MKKQKTQNKSRWLFVCLLSLLMTLGGTSTAWAVQALPYNYGFEDYDLATDGWTKYFGTSLTKNNNECAIVGDAKKTGSYGFRFSSYQTSGANAQYLISPEFNAPNGINVSFYYKVSNASGHETFKVGYSTTDTDVANFTWGEEISTNSTSWLEYENTFPAGTKYVAIYYYANYQYRLYVDDFSFTSVASGPALAVVDGSTQISSGYSYNFGLTTAGATHYFTLSNPGTESITLNIAATNGFGVSNSSLTLAAKESTLLTVTMADATASGTVTITPIESVDPFTINVSGTIPDPNKVYETLLKGSIPNGWTSSGTWTWSTTNGASNTTYYDTSNYRIITPKLTVAEGETFFFDARGTYTGYQGVKFEYSADGTNWTASATTTTLTSDWQTFMINDIPAGSYYIAIHGWQCNIRNFYGGELPNEPKMVVTQPASLSFGVINQTGFSNKTFTIANTGKATLENITVTTSESEVLEYAFHISDAPTSLAAGASQEVTIKMGGQYPLTILNVGSYSTDIKVNATGMDEVKFTVEGAVIGNATPKEEFTDGLPANWTNTSWTFADGTATGKSYSAYLTTPKLNPSEGNFIVVKIKNYDNDATNYIRVQGSNDNGSTWTSYDKQIYSSQFQSSTEWTTLVFNNIPTSVNKLRFIGNYCVVDEIMNLNYAPVLSVTTGDPAATVTSPAAYDFGECAANANVTYNFANAGGGTINITGVAITGDGASEYSTNFDSENKPAVTSSSPFNLVITRTYDAGRAGNAAQAAVVTVTTSEGEFVINVTGTDKAANAPELAVNPNVIDFGGTTVDVVTSVDVTNNGTGSMSVNIYSNNDDFTVSPAILTGIGAGETKFFNVTFKHGAPYGVKNGQIAVVPTYDTSAAVNINVTGKAKDPNAWSEDFTANTTPAGWEAGANWTIADGVAKGAYAYSSTTYLTTPTLKVNGTTDELTFDYQATSNYVNIKIQMSKDGAEFTDLNTISDLNNGNTGTYTITGLEAGNYQFRFKNDNYNLDNFEGFVLNMADHIMTITDNTIPTSGLKEGQSFEASVTVKEIRGVNEENVVAKLYMGTEVIGTSEATSVDANESKVISITCTPTTSGTNVEMYIEVTYAGGTLSTTTVKRNVAAITYLTLDETSSDAIVAGTYDNVTLKRKFTSGWNTVCLPFTISNVEAFFGAGAKAYNFSSYTDGNLGFTSVPTLTASYPYIVYVPTAITDDIELTDITIASGDATAFYRYQSGAYFRGTYAPVAAGEWTKTNTDDIIYGVVGATGRIQQAGSSASIKGFRAYFDLPASASAPSISFEDAATGIKTVITADELNQNGEVYNLNGQKVQNAHKGLYIVNGRKVVVNRK